MTRGLAHLLLIAILVISAPVAAAEVTHKAGDTETLESIAKNYYGASWKSVYIQAANNLTGKETIAGRRLVIPGCWSYSVRRGDSLTAIAKKRLGVESRYQVLMRFNNLKDPADLEVGRDLLMPFHVTHVVQAGDTLEKLSRRYYRTTKYASVIKEYNGTDSLKTDAKLTIPIFDNATLDLKKRRYNAATPSAPDNAQTSGPIVAPALEPSANEARARLEKAMTAYNGGDYEAACGELDNLLNDNKVVGNDRVPLFKYLGFCAVAYADLGGARDYFKKWIELEPKASLDPVTTSPKILAVFYEVNNQGRPASSSDENPSDGGAPR